MCKETMYEKFLALGIEPHEAEQMNRNVKQLMIDLKTWKDAQDAELHAPGARPDNVRETGCFS